MEKETKRIFQKMLEIIQEQQEAIRNLQIKTTPSARRSEDGIGDRISRIADEVSERESFAIDWRRLCDRHYATKS
jgi:hypothetical protein